MNFAKCLLGLVLDEKWARYMVLGLRLLYLGASWVALTFRCHSRCFFFPSFFFCIALQDASDTPIEHPISKTAQIVEACAFASTGNALKVQAMLHHCDEHICHYDNFCNFW
jgi:26S proteasome regulatory subunit N1